MNEESTTLYFKQGSSDKQYTVTLVNGSADFWDVFFQYGRRGGPQKTGQKCDNFPYEKAKAVYDKLIHAKQLKGYTVDGEALAFADNPNAGTDTGFRPQLLNEVTQEEAEDFFLTNMGNVAMQIKWDGERRAAILEKGIPNTFTNREGQVKGVLQSIDDACTVLLSTRPLVNAFELDTEDMGEYLVVFDMTRVGGVDMKPRSFKERAETMEILQSIIKWEGLEDYLKLEIPTYPESLKEFRAFIDRCRLNNEEGVVIRLASAPYEPGKPNSGGNCLKLKFTASATCCVQRHTEGKRSVDIAVRDDRGGDYMEIGKVTIPPNYDMPRPGELVEIKYMNIMRGEGAKLFQPRYKGRRSDKAQPDYYSSLKFKKD